MADTLQDQQAPLDVLVGEDGAPVIVNGDLQLSRGLAGIAQLIRTALELVAGEWWLDDTAGIPLLTEIVGVKTPRMERIRAAIVRRILTVRFVQSVEVALTFDEQARQLYVDFTAKTPGGTATGTAAISLEDGP